MHTNHHFKRRFYGLLFQVLRSLPNIDLRRSPCQESSLRNDECITIQRRLVLYHDTEAPTRRQKYLLTLISDTSSSARPTHLQPQCILHNPRPWASPYWETWTPTETKMRTGPCQHRLAPSRTRSGLACTTIPTVTAASSPLISRKSFACSARATPTAIPMLLSLRPRRLLSLLLSSLLTSLSRA